MPWVFIESRTVCRACGKPCYVAGVVPQGRCSCGADRPLKGSTWGLLLMHSGHAAALDEPQDFDITDEILGVWGKGEPRCGACGAELLAVDTAPDPDATSVACPGCGAASALYAPPAFVEGVHMPDVRVLVGPPPRALPIDTVGSAFHCPTCGVSLEVGATRTFPCSHCGTSVYVPDAVWDRVNPAPKPRRWYLWTGSAESPFSFD